MNSSIFDDLNESQKEAIRYFGGHLLILAGAGSGKTRVLTHKIAYLLSKGARPSWVLAMTFTNKAAQEMRDRIAALVPECNKKVWSGTFHSFGGQLLRRHPVEIKKEFDLPPGFQVAGEETKNGIIKAILKNQNIAQDFLPGIRDAITNEYVSWRPGREIDGNRWKWHAIAKEYRLQLRAKNMADFDDLMMLPVMLMDRYPEILEEERKRINFLFVDEYQDVCDHQYILLKQLIGPKSRITVVGDPDQAIYGWRGANLNMILNFEKDFAGAKTIVLEENYRSSANILSAANSLIKNNNYRKPKNLKTQRMPGFKIVNAFTSDYKTEAKYIINEAKRLHEAGYAYRDIAILYRQNAESRVFEDTATELGVPKKVLSGVGFFKKIEINEVLCILRAATNPKDSVALSKIAGFWLDGVGLKKIGDFNRWIARQKYDDPLTFWQNVGGGSYIISDSRVYKSIRAFALKISELLTIARKDKSPSAIQYILDPEQMNYVGRLKSLDPQLWGERLANVEELITAFGDGDLETTLPEISLLSNADCDKNSDAINLLTLHAAKGLEFPVVFVAGLEEGVFPIHKNNETIQEMEEERRLCYVGMTRAKEKLYLTGSEFRILRGKEYSDGYSRFMFEVPDKLKEKIYIR